MGEVREVKALAELQEALAANETVIVEFGAAWCGPCRSFLPHFKKFAEMNRDILCLKVDVDSDPGFISEFEIQSVPQVMLFSNGEYVKHLAARTVLSLQSEVGGWA